MFVSKNGLPVCRVRIVLLFAAVCASMLFAFSGVSAAGQCSVDPVSSGKTVIGSDCADVLVAEPGTKEIYAGPGDDIIFATPAVRLIDGGPGDDTIVGEIPAELETGATRASEGTLPGAVYLGGPGDDRIYATGFVIAISGDEGNDVMFGEIPDRALDGDLPRPSKLRLIAPGVVSSTSYPPAKHHSSRAGSRVDRQASVSVSLSPCPPSPPITYCGAGSQIFNGGSGADIAFGQRGNDTLIGNQGNDRLYGGVGDDSVYGSPDNDLVSGGMGTDTVDGNNGSDVVRGDGTTDNLLDSSSGQSDSDTLSFATAVTPGFTNPTPSGLPAPPSFPSSDGERGVMVRIDGVAACSGQAASFEACNNNAALGGGFDTVGTSGASGPLPGFGFERIVGSPYADYIIGDARANRIDGGGGTDVILGGGGDDQLFGGAEGDYIDGSSPLSPPFTDSNSANGGVGDDFCLNASTTSCERNSGTGYVAPRNQSLISVGFMATDGMDPAVNLFSNLYLTGSTARDHVTIAYDQANDTITFAAQSGSASFDLTGAVGTNSCSYNSPTQVVCQIPASPARPLDSIVLAGLGGNDQFSISGFPATTSVVELGGEGSDILVSFGTEDMLVDGPGPGYDILEARGGDDILINNDGIDSLSGENGNDLLLSTNRCDGDTVNGGPGEDNASWAKMESGRVVADLRSQSAGGDVNGTGYPSCSTGTLDTILAIENLEGSDGNDRLTGGGGDNGLLGRLGEDRMFGLSGNDFLQAYDDPPEADGVIDCGPGEYDSATRDVLDPGPISC